MPLEAHPIRIAYQAQVGHLWEVASLVVRPDSVLVRERPAMAARVGLFRESCRGSCGLEIFHEDRGSHERMDLPVSPVAHILGHEDGDFRVVRDVHECARDSLMVGLQGAVEVAQDDWEVHVSYETELIGKERLDLVQAW
jgi:hypothetical protein